MYRGNIYKGPLGTVIQATGAGIGRNITSLLRKKKSQLEYFRVV